MVDKRHLVFPQPTERYDFSRAAVLFNGNDGEKVVLCAISKEVLTDHLGDDNEAPLKIFITNRKRIEHEARRKYLTNHLEEDGSIQISTIDL